jgi:two-component system cell cycle response regulator DivK
MKRKALLVEDNENNRYLMTLLLTQCDFEVVIAKDGRSALNIVRKELPDFILLDIQMPEMDGYEVASQLKADPELATIPIVGVSSFAMPGDREKAMRMGFAGYIEKPIDPERFTEVLTTVLERYENPER